MKFLADGMLGKLTRWLRILGQNVKYSTQFDDEELASLARKEDPVLLTRDFDLYKRSISSGLNVFFIETKDHTEQLAQLSSHFSFPLKLNFALSRCPKCNARLRPIQKEKIADKVEKNTFDHYQEFWRCLNCKQIYWHGAHWGRIRTTLRKADLKLKLS
jgi:hypothetical protein